jgi:hypothetical protein
VVYEHFHGPPGSMCVLCRCGNNACVNPDHLYAAPTQTNVLWIEQQQKVKNECGERM